jgi:hypothetical protein
MKNRLRTFFCACSLLWAGTAVGQNTLPNASFETWETRPLSNERPQGWFTADDIINQVFAAQLTPKTISTLLGSRAVPSILLLGDRFRVSILDLTDPSALADLTRTRGIPYTGRPTQMSFWHKFAGTTADQAQVILVLTKGNLNSGGRIVGSGTASFIAGNTTYTRFTMPITYASTEAPDSLRIGFVVGADQRFSSSAAYTVDDISLSTVTATASPAVAAALNVYPNPSTNGLFSLASLQKPSVATAPLSVTDALGKVVLQQAAAPTSAANGRSLDLRGLPAGVYLLRLDTPEGIVVRKLQLQ